jgi:hypothetical protein
MLYHELTVARGDDLGSKEARRSTPLFPMGFSLLKEDRRAATLCEAICKLRHKAGLTETVATKNLACELDAANPDGFVGYSFKRNLIARTS